MDVNVKGLTVDEITTLISQLKAELTARETAPSLVVYTHDCHNASNHHKNKYKHWSKHVKSIDLTKANAYAFVGPFLNVFAENMIITNSIVVEVCDDSYTAYRIIGNEQKEEICTARRGSLRGMITSLNDLLA